jgi:hypothetical protein
MTEIFSTSINDRVKINKNMYFLLYLFILYCFVCSSSNSEPQREEILFEKVDKNLDGYLTKAELDSVFLRFRIRRTTNKTIQYK